MLVVDIVHGVLAYRIYEENTTADVFDNFLANEFMAVAGRGRYVMCDNLAAHFTDGKAATTLKAAGHRLIARPAYSPDMAPIESCFSKLKAFLLLLLLLLGVLTHFRVVFCVGLLLLRRRLRMVVVLHSRLGHRLVARQTATVITSFSLGEFS